MTTIHERVTAPLAARRLGVILRDHRTRIGALRVADIARAAGVSQPTWSQVENGAAVPSRIHLDGAMAALEVNPDDVAELIALRERAKHREWWHAYDAVTSPSLRKTIGYEASATSIQHCSAGWIPGLLQTPTYARAAILLPGATARPENIERMVELRMTRSRILTDPDTQHHAIAGEEALRYQPGGPDVLREQLRHLLELTTTSTRVIFQAVPFSAGLHLGHSSPYTIFRFAHERDTPLFHLEHGGMSTTTDSPRELARWTYVFDELTRMALTPADTTRLIESIIKELP